jgi:hypothetical protein
MLSNTPREVSLGGKPYLVSKLTLKEWDGLTAFLKDHGIDPFVSAWSNFNRLKAAGVPVSDDDRKAFFLAANQQTKVWPPPVGSLAWFELMGETDGATKRFFGVALRKHQPALTDAEIDAIFDAVTREESAVFTSRALGFSDPKADAPTEGASPPA